MPALSSLADLKIYAKVGAGDTTDDDFLTSLLDATEQRFKNDVGWDIVSASRTIYASDINGVRYMFPYGPVTAVTVASLTDFENDTWTDLTASTYKLRTEGRLSWVDYPSGFSSGTDYRFTHTVGYASNAVPDDIQHCIKVFAAIEYLRSGRADPDRDWDMVKGSTNDKGMVATSEWNPPNDLWTKTVEAYKAR